MKFKSSLIVLSLATSLVLPANLVSAQASHYRTAHVTRKITVYHWIKGSSFATSRLGAHLRLTKGRKISIMPFYHMGKDGYMLHVKGHGNVVYYARTNSTHWFKY